MHLRSLAVLACALAPAAAFAQAPRYTVETLAAGVHAVIYDSQIDVEGNTLVVVNDEDVFVVDSNAGVTTAKATIDEIRKITPKPVRYTPMRIPGCSSSRTRSRVRTSSVTRLRTTRTCWT
jgi:hypothetical protein